MKTYVYMIRHGESPKAEGTERTRGLTDRGHADAARLTDALAEEGIDVFVSSPYRRAALTMEPLARRAGQPITIIEDLKERIFTQEDVRMPDEELMPMLEKSFSDPSYALPGGESNSDCQKRAVAVLNQLLAAHPGRAIAIGTHGAVMTLMMGHYDKRFGLEFLLGTTKPDVYRMEFDGLRYVRTRRLWDRVQAAGQGTPEREAALESE
ncbi:hypothetical protein PAESOLCIP111_05083 [Paenibacillus solanacearum]|uniref:Histidine phosphatase family protein n=1 Tax=Paenibacillus solanacearum TaxID=2048548 RepID=A0A916NYJ3_9BACL|nr:histidine phosphatase family protein [Paenibacillus solanacearum]CAG7646031.1 hypothetical protein PAESOLCIP111_05083 [Paenibacillus solanacearum]